MIEFQPAPLLRIGVEALLGTVVATALAFVALTGLQAWLGVDPPTVGLIVQIAFTSAAFGVGYLAVSVVLRIPELPSIVGIMADVVRRPRRT